VLKKAKADFESKSKSGPEQGIAKGVLESSHQIWLAGLGAFAKAQEGGAKVFDTLVKQGEVLEARTRKAAAQTADAARDAAMSKAKEVQAMAGGTWDKLEQVFEARVSRALAKLGVHTSADVDRLSERVNELSEAVNALLKAQGIPRKQAARTKASAAGRSARAGASAPTAADAGTRTPSAGPAAKKARKTGGKRGG